ncbi:MULTISPECIES: CfaE/CblD family pilus tip adhesin [Rahnella]|uniref:Phage tail protein n=1 Tax=Rahnella laticis TaxID=2787622 RepID=A0ABS0E284_9GAMM|nr:MULTISPECIES: CfaE/CblD family pilus tip adhesin [Rahnella]MBF7979196.1 hypothetical protein [Rahnella laticis]MBF7999539.1 hypothetical protein [Rahnella sp. LAC-M12]
MSSAGAVSRTTAVSETLDMGSLPSYVSIWQGLVSRDSSTDTSHANDSLVCQSYSDATYGACNTSSIFRGTNVTASAITLTFTNAARGRTQKLTVRANRCKYSSSCYAGSDTDYSYEPWNGFKGTEAVYAAFTYWIPNSELAKLTTTGTWTATLWLSLKNKAGTSNAETDRGQTWTANITLTVKGPSAQIYFPAFPDSTPSVNLNLSNLPGSDNNTRASGSNTLDMCLYDGNDSTSSSMTLLFEDSVGNGDTTGRNSGLFSLFQYNVTVPSGRLDYQVSFVNPVTGSPQVVANGIPITLDTRGSGVATRNVLLPGYADVYVCIPAPLTFTTPEFVLSSKYRGNYFGTLTVTYTPSTS